MCRTTVARITLSLIVVLAGCRMCASPYDECSPTFTGQCGEQCLPTARAGSILSRSAVPPSDALLFSGPFPPDEDISPGAIASVADGEVAESSGESAQPGEPHLAKAKRPTQAQGWTAARPTPARHE